MKSESQNPYFLFDTEQDRQTDQCTNQSIAFVFTNHHHMYLHACIVFFILFYYFSFCFPLLFLFGSVSFRSVPFCYRLYVVFSFSTSFFSSLFSFYCVNLVRFFSDPVTLVLFISCARVFDFGAISTWLYDRPLNVLDAIEKHYFTRCVRNKYL